MAPKQPQVADAAELAAELGVEMDAELFRRALTHRSFAYENGDVPHNERLEFLGDSVLGVVVTEALYRRHPDLAEGKLAKLRASVVNMRALADVARGIGEDGIGKYILLGRGEDATGGRDKASILADTLEAILGAIHLQHGIVVASSVIFRLFDPVLAGGQRARRGAGLEDLAAGADRRARAGRAGLPDHLGGPRPRQVLHRGRGGRRGDLRRPARPEQEGGRAGRGRGRLAPADRAGSRPPRSAELPDPDRTEAG